LRTARREARLPNGRTGYGQFDLAIDQLVALHLATSD
jgi:hypothetical protein